MLTFAPPFNPLPLLSTRNLSFLQSQLYSQYTQSIWQKAGFILTLAEKQPSYWLCTCNLAASRLYADFTLASWQKADFILTLAEKQTSYWLFTCILAENRPQIDFIYTTTRTITCTPMKFCQKSTRNSIDPMKMRIELTFEKFLKRLAQSRASRWNFSKLALLIFR